MVCSILGVILGFDGFVINIMLTTRPIMFDPSTFFSFYYYSSILVFVGIDLIFVGLGFGWQASQEKLRVA
jgi:hypothetical protein